MPKRRKYKFTGRKHSKLGAVALCFGLTGIAGIILGLVLSSRADGQLTAWIGIFGICALALSVLGIIMAIMAVRDDDMFPIMPRAGLIASLVGALGWIAIYVIGFFFGG
jgi:hypothetical protein